MGSPPQPPPPTSRSPAPAPQPQWVALRRVPRADPDLTADFHAALDAPPGLASLAVPPFVTAGSDASGCSFPFVLAADPSGVLLLYGSHGQSLASGEPGARASYSLCDAVSNTVRRLPVRPANRTGAAGLIVAGSRDGDVGLSDFMVAELVTPTACDGSATLHCFSPGSSLWIQKSVRFPDRIRLPWYSADVLSYQEKLWWVDLSQGLLACDPYPSEPELQFVPLPASVRFAKGDKQRDASKHRCLNLSGGRLRLVVITAHACVPKIKLWTLTDPATGEWTLDQEARLEDIWDDQSYRNTGLPKKRPALGLVHPINPGVVYFFLQEHLFGVDLRTKAVTEYAKHEHHEGEGTASSTSVLGWELPPSLTTLPSGPSHGTEPRATSAFDRIADSFMDAYTCIC